MGLGVHMNKVLTTLKQRAKIFVNGLGHKMETHFINIYVINHTALYLSWPLDIV